LIGFDDQFSPVARGYLSFRPRYPAGLFAFLAGLAPGRELAWDVGTGSGQAAADLAHHFSRVLATDASADQIRMAPRVSGVEYRVEPAESVTLSAGSVDLVTAAASAHWFDLAAFYREVDRVLRPGGVIAVWAYHLPEVGGAADRALSRYSSEILGPYWPPAAEYVLKRYETLPFPFDAVESPRFEVEVDWDLRELLGFLGSWSAAVRYEQVTGRSPVENVGAELLEAWGDPKRRRRIRCPLFLRVGSRRSREGVEST